MGSNAAGFWVALGVGLALLVAASWRDAVTRRRALSAAQGYDAGGAAGLPSDLGHSLGVDRFDPTPLTSAERQVIADWRSDDSTHQCSLTLADPRLATHHGPLEMRDDQTTHDDPVAITGPALLLVCADPISGIRELLPGISQARESSRTLVVAAPSFDADVLDTLAVNLRARLLSSVPLVGTRDVLDQLAGQLGASIVTRAALRSGSVSGESSAVDRSRTLTPVDRLVVDHRGCWISFPDLKPSPAP